MIYLILGPSGAGKDRLSLSLLERGIPKLISHTTRLPREGECEGVNYYYVNHKRFAHLPMIESTEYASNFYGTSRAEVDRVLSSGGNAFAILDRHGVEEFKRIYGDSVKVIYIYANSKVLAAHMRAQGRSEDDIAERLIHAIKSGEFDNLEVADYCIVNSGSIEKAIAQLRAIVGM